MIKFSWNSLHLSKRSCIFLIILYLDSHILLHKYLLQSYHNFDYLHFKTHPWKQHWYLCIMLISASHSPRNFLPWYFLWFSGISLQQWLCRNWYRCESSQKYMDICLPLPWMSSRDQFLLGENAKQKQLRTIIKTNNEVRIWCLVLIFSPCMS